MGWSPDLPGGPSDGAGDGSKGRPQVSRSSETTRLAVSRRMVATGHMRGDFPEPGGPRRTQGPPAPGPTRRIHCIELG